MIIQISPILISSASMFAPPEDGRKELHLPQLVSLYTEVSPLRAEELLRGQMESVGEARGNLIRWLSETVLIQTEPEDLKALGISRLGQPVFATPIPYQGGEPMRDKVILAFDTDPNFVFVAEGDHLTAMRQFGVVDMEIYVKLQQLIGKGRSVTQREFQQHYDALPEDMKRVIEGNLTPIATDYWESVIPYTRYLAIQTPYVEPETLLTPSAKLSNVRRI